MQTLTKIRKVLTEIAMQDAVIAKQMQTIKGNLLAAFKPLWEAVYPAVVAILNVITMITSALANLSIKIFGDIGKTAKGSTELLKGEAEAIGDVANAAKSATKELGTFDEINQISMSGGAGGGVGGALASSAGLLTDLSWSFEDIYRRMMAINWEQVAARINSALLNIDFAYIASRLRVGAQYILNALNELLTGINWATLGANIADGFDELVTLLPDIAETLANWFNAKINLFYGFVTSFDWQGLGQSISDGIETFFATTDWATWGEGISNFATGVLDALITVVTETDWSAVGDALYTVLSSIDWEDVFLKVTELIMATSLRAFGGLVDGIANLFGIEDYPKFWGEDEADWKSTSFGREQIAAKDLFDIEGLEDVIVAIVEGRTEYSEFKNVLNEGVGIDMSSVTLEIWSLRNQFRLGEIDANQFAEALRSYGATEEQINYILTTLNSTIDDNIAKNGEMAIVNDELRLSALNVSNDIGALGQALIDSGLSNDKARLAYQAFSNALANDEGVEDYRLALENLGFTQAEIDALFVALGITTSDIATSMDTTAEAVNDISDDMDDAAEAAEDMATATETVADNSEDAETAIDAESTALTDIVSDADSATTAQEDLTDATISLADATDTGATNMDSALARNLANWRAYAVTLTTIMDEIRQGQIHFWGGFAPAAEQAASAMSAAFSNAAANIESTFNSAWQSVINGLSAGGGTFSAITDGVASVIRRQLNSLISGLNSVLNSSFKQANGIFEKLRNTEVLGTYPFSKIRNISIPRIPALAKGAVIPANHEFLAILGDQKHGTNIEAPLDTIVQAMMIALDRSGATRGGATAAEIAAAMSGMAVKFDRVVVGRVVAEQIDANRRADGKFAYDLA